MARKKGIKNKETMVRPPTSELTADERMQVVADLIIDRIFDDEEHGQRLLKQLAGYGDA